MTYDTLDDHFERLCNDIKDGNVADAEDIVAQDEAELDRLEEISSAEASGFRPAVQDEEFLHDVVKFAAQRYPYQTAA